MKFKKTAKLLITVTIFAIVAACTQNSGKFQLKGKLSGIVDGKAILIPVSEDKNLKSDTVLIKNGEFTFTGDVPEPVQYFLKVEGKESGVSFYVENSKMTITGNVDTLYKAVITGSLVYDEARKYSGELIKLIISLRENYKLDSLTKVYQVTNDEVTKKEIAKYSAELRAQTEKKQWDYIRQNPASYYTAILIKQLAKGKSAAEIEDLLKQLDPKLNDTKIVAEIRDMIQNLKTSDVSVDAFTNNAPEMSYSVDNTFTGAGFKDVVYLAKLPNDNICALRKDGLVIIINPKGVKVTEFKSEIKGKPSAIAVDESENIYVFSSIYENKSAENRGKAFHIETPVKVECLVFSTKGVKIRSVELAGIVTATGTRVADDKIMVADTRGAKIVVYNSKTGEKISSIEKLRTCCMILDFSIRNNEILVANLAAFRVNGFDYSGKPTVSFGKRGSGINDFHGCCNPVSVAFLSNGGIVTVEKDPTRIKTYSKDGAKVISGIDELVKGCKYIPMTVDSKDNVYLASMTGGIIKCIQTK